MFAFAGFSFDGELLSFHNPDIPDEEVLVSEDGELSVRGEPVPLNARAHELLEELFAEAARLGQALDDAGEHLPDWDGENPLRLLEGENPLGDGSAPAHLAEQLERVRAIIDTVRDRVPELAELDWLGAE